jgi:signal transduction histidine kinase
MRYGSHIVSEDRLPSPPTAGAGRSVATRVLLAFAAMLVAFLVTASWSIVAQRRTAADSEELAKGYVPVALKLGQLRATQAAISTIVEGLPDERDPLGARMLLSSLAGAREAKLVETRAAIAGLQEVGTDESKALATQWSEELDGFEAGLVPEKAAFERLFAAMASGDSDGINRTLIEVGPVEIEADKRLHTLADHVSISMDALSLAARARVTRAIWSVVGLVVLTLAVSVAMTLQVRRILAPLARVTERAKAVGRGDLTPKEVPDGGDEIGALAASFERMVGELSKAQRSALESERLAAIGKMAAHVTHEIRNPLSSIGLNVEMLEEELAEGASGDAAKHEARELLSSIRREVERLESLSEEYLRMARLPQPRMEADDVAQAVRDVATFSKKEMENAGCTIELVVDGDADGRVPPALFDEGQLRQALLNLLRNAREAMPEGGVIDVSVRAEGMSVVIRVEDRGAGIPEEIRTRVFDPFFSTKGQGTGLGLAITRQIVEAHGGELVCEPRPGGGTIFKIALPIAPERAVAPAASWERVRATSKPKA